MLRAWCDRASNRPGILLLPGPVWRFSVHGRPQIRPGDLPVRAHCRYCRRAGRASGDAGSSQTWGHDDSEPAQAAPSFSVDQHADSPARSGAWHARRPAVPSPAAADPVPELEYTTSISATTATFLTGIRGDNIVGNYVVPEQRRAPAACFTAAIPRPGRRIRSRRPTGSISPAPISTSPYGPSFGSQDGILRVVGSYRDRGLVAVRPRLSLR